MRFLLLLVCAFLSIGYTASLKTDVQIREQRKALKELEKDLGKKREQLMLLETEEKSVFNTLSLLDQNLTQTREYVSMLASNEAAVEGAVRRLSLELDSLDAKTSKQQAAMQRRIRTLYIQGRYGEGESLYRLLREKENPEKQLYLVGRLLLEDKMLVSSLQASLKERAEKKALEAEHLKELRLLRSKKASEESKLVFQIGNQNEMLFALKRDKNLQKKVLQEFERNQKTMIVLIKRLEEKRKKEEAEAKRKALEKKKKAKGQKLALAVKKEPPPVVIEKVVGPKTMPMEGAVISNYGFQEHTVLHIMTRNLGIEIRGRRGGKVKAAAKGKVVMVAEIDGRGPSVIIEHDGGLYSVYGHLNSIRVQEGNLVRNGEEIGEVGNIASLNGIKLYFQVSQGTQTIDPLEWLKEK